MILKHSKSTLAHGVRMLLTGGLFAIGIACFFIYGFSWAWKQSPVAVVLGAGFLILWLIGIGFVAFVNIRKNETFVCLIDDEFIECVCPAGAFGDSFRLRLNEVARIEKEGDRWYVCDGQGGRYWLTSHYGNPADKFVGELKRLKPDIEEVGV